MDKIELCKVDFTSDHRAGTVLEHRDDRHTADNIQKVVEALGTPMPHTLSIFDQHFAVTFSGFFKGTLGITAVLEIARAAAPRFRAIDVSFAGRKLSLAVEVWLAGEVSGAKSALAPRSSWQWQMWRPLALEPDMSDFSPQDRAPVRDLILTMYNMEKVMPVLQTDFKLEKDHIVVRFKNFRSARGEMIAHVLRVLGSTLVEMWWQAAPGDEHHGLWSVRLRKSTTPITRLPFNVPNTPFVVEPQSRKATRKRRATDEHGAPPHKQRTRA